MEKGGRAKLLSRVPKQVRDASEERSDDDAVYLVLPSEVRSLKDLRVVVDELMLSTTPMWSRVDIFSDMFPSVAGINTYLRSNFFENSKRCKRDEKAPLTNTASGKLPRGRPRKGAQRSDEQLQLAAEARKETMRNVQRQSKQRVRCENKLLTLLFACLYDTSVKTNPLTKNIPPLHRTVAYPATTVDEEDGTVRAARRPRKIRKISNYPAVRSFLRKIMCELISLQASAIRTVVHHGTPLADLIPSGTVNIMRTFLIVYELESGVLSATTSTAVHNSDGDSRMVVNARRLSEREVLNKTLDSILDTISQWWRRNYTPDNHLSNCQALTRRHPLITASESLISSIIELSVSHHSDQSQGDGSHASWLYSSGCVGEDKCHEDSPCVWCEMSSVDVTKWMEPCQKVVESLSRCVELLGHCPIEVRHDFLRTSEVALTLPLWNEMHSQSAFHRMQSLSTLVEKLDSKCKERGTVNGRKNVEDRSRDQAVYRARLEDHRRELVRTVRFHVGKFWNVLSASNAKTLHYLRSFQLRDTTSILDLAIKVVFSGSVSSEVLLERSPEVASVTERLFAISKEVCTETVGGEEMEGEDDVGDGDVQGERHDEDLQGPQHDGDGDKRRESRTGRNDVDITVDNVVNRDGPGRESEDSTADNANISGGGIVRADVERTDVGRVEQTGSNGSATRGRRSDVIVIDEDIEDLNGMELSQSNSPRLTTATQQERSQRDEVAPEETGEGTVRKARTPPKSRRTRKSPVSTRGKRKAVMVERVDEC